MARFGADLDVDRPTLDVGTAAWRPRLARLASVDGHPLRDTAPILVPADAGEARRGWLHQLAQLGGDPRASAAHRLEAWTRGELDDEHLDAAARLGLHPGDWVGTHESLLTAIGRRALSLLASEVGSRVALTAIDVGTSLLAPLPVEARRAGQAWWIDRHAPDRIRHVGRLFPPHTDLAPVRAAYLEQLDAISGGDRNARARSSVAFVHRFQAGEREGLFDWAWEARRRDADARGFRHATIRTNGGLHLRLDVLDAGTLAEPVFGARELLRADREPATVLLGTDDVGAVATPRAIEPASTFPVLDAILELLGDAAGLPPDATRLRDEPVVPVDPPAHALPRLLRLGEACTFVSERLPIASLWSLVAHVSEPDEDTWIDRAGEELARRAAARWLSGLRELHDAVASHRGPRRPSFREVARRWLTDCPSPRHPPGRRRAAGRVVSFHLDPLRRWTDVALLRACYEAEPDPLHLTAWCLREWPMARDALTPLCARAVTDPIGFTAWLATAADRLRDPRAFRTAVTHAGLLPWSLAELDHDLEDARPQGTSSSAWRSAAASRAWRLPRRPWSTEGVATVPPELDRWWSR